ncbi:MAG: hypothetical protein N2235_25855, partial [Fischerella sp.]|nr:hypothetical protein [Fischerella sp.]
TALKLEPIAAIMMLSVLYLIKLNYLTSITPTVFRYKPTAIPLCAIAQCFSMICGFDGKLMC